MSECKGCGFVHDGSCAEALRAKVERLHALASSLAGALRGLAVALDVCYYRDTWADRDTWVDKGDTHKAWDAARKALAEYEAATTKDVKP